MGNCLKIQEKNKLPNLSFNHNIIIDTSIEILKEKFKNLYLDDIILNNKIKQLIINRINKPIKIYYDEYSYSQTFELTNWFENIFNLKTHIREEYNEFISTTQNNYLIIYFESNNFEIGFNSLHLDTKYINTGGTYNNLENPYDMMITFGISMLTNFAKIDENQNNSEEGILKVDIFQNYTENNLEDYF